MADAIAPIVILPVFFKLGGRRVILAGGTPPAAWKAELLAAAGAEVLVLAEEPCAALEERVAARPDRLTLVRRGWRPADLAGVALAVGAFEDEAAGTLFRDAARARGVPVNVIDVPPLCDFQFGTIVERSPLLIGISTDGAAPVLGQALRARIEALLPPAMGAWAEAARRWRAPLQAMRLGFAARRRYWETFAEMALEGGAREPQEADRLACEAAALATERRPDGRVLLVGAGPGAADLVTLAAVKALQSADDIVYEAGIGAAALGLGRREAVRRPAGPAAVAEAVAAAEAGATVAWIGPGDPGTCEVWTRRREAIERTGRRVECVRGISCGSCPHGCAAATPAQ